MRPLLSQVLRDCLARTEASMPGAQCGQRGGVWEVRRCVVTNSADADASAGARRRLSQGRFHARKFSPVDWLLR